VSTPALFARGLAVGYTARRSRRVVLDGLDLDLVRGRLTCLLGPNGSGKSTLLRTLVGLQDPLAGRVALDGRALAHLPPLERARLLGVVLTDPVDVGLLMVEDLVALGRYPHTGWTGRMSAGDRDACRWAMACTGADALAGRPVTELSDGERQRVLIARALAQRPQVLALDEPLAFIDAARRVELVGLLRGVAIDHGLAVLLTSHDLELAVRSADVLWLVDGGTGGPGGRVHVGAPEDLILAGAVERAFDARGLRFDAERGTFVERPRPLADVHLRADGAARTWTARALEREGLRLVDHPEAAQLHVEHVAGEAARSGRWLVRSRLGGSEHASIGELAEAVRALVLTGGVSRPAKGVAGGVPPPPIGVRRG
jgi:iron complex transport system ATP-binding protein